jgi:hypothetical protein
MAAPKTSSHTAPTQPSASSLKFGNAADADAALLSMETAYKLASSPKNLRLTNMHLFSGRRVSSGTRRCGRDVTDHAAVRLRTYIARKAHQLAELELIVSKVSARARSHRRHRCRHAGPAGPRLSWAPLEESAYPRSGTMAFVHLLMPVSSLTIEAGEALETTPPRPRGRA